MDNVGWDFDWQAARIEAEAALRKDDEALIRQMREALNLCCMAMDYLSEDERISDAITAADARLEKAP